ncbi:hypothetical protein BASA50_002562 [Batrachochytrium salamandrivorans]|uniref:G-protein coupled receptors family 3 profile domain-containing protein n=1 Tax=Batrachochytrium salamandrivorans TaxID=1357716 RepID=A0ABQ8FL70_9FUNG|nr:hypothetical protein BASA62_008494 [Batrachochytrium salamandrivorans]KAH6600103.1 hypothetical protein BASA50_002562 [Batrachochytrium salamandrivorans]
MVRVHFFFAAAELHLGSFPVIVDDYIPADLGPEASTLLVIGIVTLSIDIIAFLIALYNQDYPPLRAKQLFLVGMGLVAGCLWFFGFMHAAGMFVLSGFFSNCPLWTVVVQISLGTQLVLITIMLRLYRLYRVIVQQKPISGLDFRFWWSVILLPMVLTAAIALILPSEDVNYLDPATGVCQFNYVFKFAIMGVVFITIIIVGVFMLFVQSKIHISAFNEFRENRILFTIALVTLFVNFFCNVTSLYRSSWAQVSVAIIDLVAVHLNFWILLFGPLYACYFNREDYLMDFLIELNGLGRSTGSSGGEGNNSNI